MQVHQVRVRGPTGISGGQRIYALESPVLEGELGVGVGETIGFLDEGLNHDGKYELPEEGTGVGRAHTGDVVGVGEGETGETMDFEGVVPDGDL